MYDIKSIIFDWGGVLIDNPTESFSIECAKRIGISVEQLENAYSDFASQFERGRLKESDLWKNIGKRLKINIKNKHSIWKECFKKIYSPRNEIFHLAKQLKKNGYVIALLSNTEIPAMNFFNEQNYDLFDYKVFSCIEGFAKPKPELYRILLDKMKISGQQTLFIDDKIENIRTANELQINTIHYKNYNDLIRNFHKNNITI